MFLLRKVRFRQCVFFTILAASVILLMTFVKTNSHNDGNFPTSQTDVIDSATAIQTPVASIGLRTLPPWLPTVNMTFVKEHQFQRQKLLQRTCQKHGLGSETPNFKTSDMYINDSIDYIYCVVNKVACTSWKRVLLMASGQMTVDKPEKLTMTYVHDWRKTDKYFPRIRYFSLDEIKRRLKTHFKFMFVRHPLERLVSTYRDKFTKKAYYYPRRFGTKIVRAVRGANASAQSLRLGHDVKFQEMVTYLLDPPSGARHNALLLSDNHWRPEHELCHPCYVQYDFVGHYETIFDDAETVLETLGVTDKAHFPYSDPDNKWAKKTEDVTRQYLNELNADQLRRVKQLYALDFELFGYDPDAFT